MYYLIYKTGSVGCSWSSGRSAIPGDDLQLCFHHKILQLTQYFKKPIVSPEFGICSIFVGQISLVHMPKELFMQDNERCNLCVRGERLSDAIDLTSSVFFVGCREKETKLTYFKLGCYVNESTKWVFPDAMEFGFYHNSFPDMNMPAKYLISAVSRDIPWNNTETFLQFLSVNRPVWDENGLFA